MEKSLGKLKYYAPYMDECRIKDFAENSANLVFKGGPHGGTSQCLFVDDYALLYSKVFSENGINPEEFRKTMQVVHGLYESGSRVAPILGYIRSEDNQGIPNNRWKVGKGKYRDLVIVKKAPGKTLNDVNGVRRFCDTITERMCNEHHYDDAVGTFMDIVHSPLKPDISRNNTLYDANESYTFIDFNALLSQMPNHYIEDCTSRFLASFVTNKNFLNEQEKKRYFDESIKEQRILVTKLGKKGISEEILDSAIKSAPHLSSSSVDELFKH